MNVTSQANWSSADEGVLTVSNDGATKGALNGIGIGEAVVTATYVTGGQTYTATRTVTVTAPPAGSVIVTPAVGLTTTEAGGQATFTVELSSQPWSDVTIAITSSDPTEGTVSVTSLTFTGDNWNAPQTVTVTGVDDDEADGDQSYTVVIAAAVSDDVVFNGVDAADVTATNTDDDTAGVTVTPTTGLSTTEAGGSATFTVQLNSKPASNVLIALSSSDSTEGTVSPASLVFTPANWNAPQTVTVTGVDDQAADGEVAYAVITAATSSADATYDGLDVDDVAVANTDNDSAGITVTAQASLTTSELGGVATFTVVLNSQPTDDVVIPLSSSDDTEGAVSPASLTFTATNWNAPQTVTVTGVDDLVADGNQPFSVQTGAAVSNDSTYAGLDADDVALHNVDNDSAGITVNASSTLVTSEGGAQATFTVVLNSQPTADVVIALSSSDETEGTVSPASLTFTAANWNAPQTVTVTGVNDDEQDGNQPFSIVTAAATSTDTGYDGLDAADVTVSNTDNDSAGITVAVGALLSVSEGSSVPATFTVVLNAQPTADVVIALSSSDSTEGTVSPASLTFTTTNWNAPQTVTVSSVDDALADGNQVFEVVIAAATSTDANYAGLDASDPQVTTIDNDSAGITVSQLSGLTTTEAGGSATFSIHLNSQPTADVVIAVTSSDLTEGTVAPATLTFTSVNWAAPQTVTVTGVDDDAQDGNQSYTITLAPSVSTDATYSGLDAPDVSVSNTDNDSAGITVGLASLLTTTEGGGTATFTIVLNSQPTADVVIGVQSSNTAEGTVSPASITFTTANWSAPVTVTVTGVDDALADHNQQYFVQFAAAVSSDANYSGRTTPNVPVTNVDNDTAGITVAAAANLTTTEAGATQTFTVVLNAQPTSNVVIGVSSSDLTEGTVSPASLTFTSTNWATPQTVTITGVDDAEQDGNQSYQVVIAAAVSSDPNFGGLTSAPVSVINTDNDSAGITVTAAAGLTTTEATGAGHTATFTVVLNSKPTANVTIGLASSDLTEGTVSPASLVFTPADWNLAQTVTVTGVDDALADGPQTYTIDTAEAVSADPNYSGRDAVNVSLSNVDNDTLGVTVSATSLTTTEAGGTATFSIVLNTAPTGTVVISLAGLDATEGTLSTNTLTFNASNWSDAAAHTVTVTGVDDSVDDDDQTYTLVTTASGADYDGFSVPDVVVTNVDDDTRGVTVSATSLSTTEAAGPGHTASFSIVLNSQPTGTVTITLSGVDATEGALSATTLTYDSSNWSNVAAHTVTVTGVDDTIADGAQAYTLITTATGADYAGFTVPDVSVSNVDDDALGVTVSATSLSTTEAAGAAHTASFSIVLNSQPTGTVTITLSGVDASEGALSTTTLIYDSSNWGNAAAHTVTVTGVDDALADGPQTYTLITTATGADYAGAAVDDVVVTNVDDDALGVTVSATSLSTTEASGPGHVASFSIVLNSQPASAVTITLSGVDASEGTLSTTTLTYDSSNWSNVAAHTVTITGVDDSIDDDAQTYTVVTTATGGDYDGFTVPDVSVTNADDDDSVVLISPAALSVSESSGVASFTVKLGSQPSGDVTVGLDWTATGDATVSASSLTFTSANWNVPQTVTVTGVPDLIDEDDKVLTIGTSITASADVLYAMALDVPDVAVTVTDDDTAGFNITPITLLTQEGGGGSFRVKLTSQPVADVTLTLTSNNTAEGLLGPTSSASLSLTFTAANWSVFQLVSVTGVDDGYNPDGNQTYTISTVSGSAGDVKYAALGDPGVIDVQVTNADNDQPGIVVAAPPQLATSEDGTSDTFSVVLSAPPTVDVIIPIAVTSASAKQEATLLDAADQPVTQLVFTASNWSTPQVITVQGVDDAVDDDDQDFTVVIYEAAAAGDDAYNGINPADIPGVNADNDAAGYTVTPVSGLITTEAGGQATYTVRLNTEPVQDVVINISSPTAAGLGTAAATVGGGTSLTFTAANWSVDQSVTVTGNDDLIDEAPATSTPYTITQTVTTTDTKYAPLDPPDVDAANMDDDQTGLSVVAGALSTTEAGGTTTFTIALQSEPTGDVVVHLATTLPATATVEGTVTTSLTFTPANWSTPQPVTVTGVPDDIDDGDQAYTVAWTLSSTDANYDGAFAGSVPVTNVDIDSAGVTLTNTGALVTTETETGSPTTATFEVVLNSKPLQQVTIAFVSNDLTEGLVTSAVTFDGNDWSTPKTVTISSVNDDVQDGPQGYTIGYTLTSSDPAYDGLFGGSVEATNNDDDAVGIVLSIDPAVDSLHTGEEGTSDTFTVALRSEPTTDVTVTFTSGNTAEADVTTPMTRSVTFNAGNWNIAQSIVVSGVNDDVDEPAPDHAFTIAYAVSSADALYAPLTGSINGFNADDDTAGLTVSTNTITTNENNTYDTPTQLAGFTLALGSQPTAPVTVTVTSSDTTEGVFPGDSASTTLTIDADGAWGDARTVQFLVGEDRIDDDAQTYTMTVTLSSADPLYNGTFSEVVTVTNNDDDTAAVVVAPTTGLVTAEDPAALNHTQTFTVVLASQPLGIVVIDLVSSNTSEGTVSPASLTFDSANWSLPQTVTVTGVDDFVDEEDSIGYVIQTSVAAAVSDPTYGVIDPADVSVTNLDNDIKGLDLLGGTDSADRLVTSENGGTAQFEIWLHSEPTADVTATFTVTNATTGTVEGSVQASYLMTPGAGTWNTAQGITVTGVDDFIDDDDQDYTVQITLTSADPNYDGVTGTIFLTNTDDDTASIAISPMPLVTVENSGVSDPGSPATSDSFTITLATHPVAPVTINLISSTDEGVHAGSVTFDPSEFSPSMSSLTKTITVVGVNDAIDDGDQLYVIATAVAPGSDVKYAALGDPADVTVINIDDDTANVIVTPTGGLVTSENGASENASFTVALATEPLGDITIMLASDTSAEGVVSAGASLTFTATNWNAPQTVTVTGVDDPVPAVDGDQPYAIDLTVTAAMSGDAYEGFSVTPVSATNRDNDSAGLVINTLDADNGTLVTREPDETDTFTVRLNSQPTADVVVSLSLVTDEATLSTSSLTFTADSWDAPQTVTVTGVDDAVADGNQPYTITVKVASSTDVNYPADAFATVIDAINEDDDTAGLIVDLGTPPTTTSTEAGGIASFTLRLRSQPTSDVTFTLTSSDVGEGVLLDATDAQVSSLTVTFTTVNWNGTQTINVQGIDDALADGAQPYNIVIANAASSDGNYNGAFGRSVALSNTDDDSAGVTVSAVSGSTNESGGTATFTVVLNSEPTDTVTIAVSSLRTSEVTVSPATLTFTAADWNLAHTVTLTGVDEAVPVADGDQIATIQIANASSAGDPNYNGIGATTRDVTNQDNDTAGFFISPDPNTVQNTSETGTSAYWYFTLRTQPTSTVTVTLSIPAAVADEGQLSPSSVTLTFDSTNWNVAHEVEVIGLADGVNDGDQAYSVITSSSASADPFYSGLPVPDLKVKNLNVP